MLIVKAFEFDCFRQEMSRGVSDYDLPQTTASLARHLRFRPGRHLSGSNVLMLD